MESLFRAEENITGQTRFWKDDSWEMGAFQLTQKLDKPRQQMVRAYIRVYLKRCGWTVRSVTFPGSAVVIKFRNELMREEPKTQPSCPKTPPQEPQDS